MIKKELVVAQNRMKQFVDKRRSEKVFKEGDMVYLRVKRFQQHVLSTSPASKLSPNTMAPRIPKDRIVFGLHALLYFVISFLLSIIAICFDYRKL